MIKLYKCFLISCLLTACQSIKPNFLLDAKQHVASVESFQEALNTSFADSSSSPLTKEDREHFNALSFFEVDSSFRVSAKFKRKLGKVFNMKTTTDRQPQYRLYGNLVFKIFGKKYRLSLYQNIQLSQTEKYKEYLFLPFTDASNGRSTYGGGRYIDFEIPRQKWVDLDFNKAYNPYCAYNGRYSCPIPPPQNDVDIEIKAGVQAPPGH